MATTGTVAGPQTYQAYAPRSRKRTKAGRYSSDISLEELQAMFHLPTEQACKRLGVGLTILKRICRRYGIPRWPYKKPTKTSYAQRVSEVPNGGAYGGYNGPAAPAPAPAPAPAHYNLAPSPFSWAQQPASMTGLNLGWGSIPPPAALPAPQPSLVARPEPRRAGAGDASLRALAAAPKHSEAHLSNESNNDRLNLLLHAIEQSEEEGEDGDMDIGAGPAAPSPRSPVSINDTLQDATNAVPPAAAPVETEKAAAATLLSQALAHLGSNAADDSKSAAVVTLVDVLASNPALAQQLAAVLAASAPAPPLAPAPAAPRPNDLAAAMHAELRKLQEHHRAHQAQQAQQAAPDMAAQLRTLQDMQRQFAAAQAQSSAEAADRAVRMHAAQQAKAAAREMALQRLQAHMAMRDALSRQAAPTYEVAPAPVPAALDQAALLQLLAAKLAQQS